MNFAVFTELIYVDLSHVNTIIFQPHFSKFQQNMTFELAATEKGIEFNYHRLC